MWIAHVCSAIDVRSCPYTGVQCISCQDESSQAEMEDCQRNEHEMVVTYDISSQQGKSIYKYHYEIEIDSFCAIAMSYFAVDI